MEIKIGLEIHVELKTKSKMFCNCKNEYGGEPNIRICPVCLGEPGTLPSPNEEAIKKSILLCLALNSEINKVSIFTRKNYFYPDLPKGYQITQYKASIGEGGYLEIDNKKILIDRVNIEEETAKSIYTEKGEVLLDFNRCGIPLLEIVTKPFISSISEALTFLKELRKLLRYLDISECDMEKGMYRVDSNISIPPNERVELKNLNSLKAFQEAIFYEIERQKEILKRGEKIKRETRLWDEFKKETRIMRIKEEELDYRYFPEPDLPPLEIDKETIEELKRKLPELPYNKKIRFIKEYSLNEKEAEILTSEKELAGFFEETLKNYYNPKEVANWILTEILAYTEPENIKKIQITPFELSVLIKNVCENELPRNIGKEILKRKVERKEDIFKMIEEEKKKIIKEEGLIEEIVKEVLEENKEAVLKYKSGKEGIIGFLIGETMKKLKGKGNPKEIRELLLKNIKDY
ncbi:MAG: Asp-tRNA(Asn)/Glu-tRNA(Gln) amidotransferase subunit GatB [candidate division WOR-3 bacterium]